MSSIKKYQDSLTGIGLLLVSALYFKGSFIETSQLMTAQYGPDFLPRVYSIVLAGLSILLITGNLNKVRREGVVETEEKEEVGSSIRTIMTIVLVMVYIASIKKVGFLISSALYMLLQLRLAAYPGTTKRDYVKFILFGIVVSCILYYLFVRLFSLALPRGIVGF